MLPGRKLSMHLNLPLVVLGTWSAVSFFIIWYSQGRNHHSKESLQQLRSMWINILIYNKWGICIVQFFLWWPQFRWKRKETWKIKKTTSILRSPASLKLNRIVSCVNKHTDYLSFPLIPTVHALDGSPENKGNLVLTNNESIKWWQFADQNMTHEFWN